MRSRYNVIIQNPGKKIADINENIKKIENTTSSLADELNQKANASALDLKADVSAIPDITGLASQSDLDSTTQMANNAAGLAVDALVLLQGTPSTEEIDALNRILEHKAIEFVLPPSKGDSTFTPSETTQGYFPVRDSNLKTVNALVSMYSSGIADSWKIDFVNAVDDVGNVKNIDNKLSTSASLDVTDTATDHLMTAVPLKSFKLQYIFSLKSTTQEKASFMWDIQSTETGYTKQYDDFFAGTFTAGKEYTVQVVKNGTALFIVVETDGDSLENQHTVPDGEIHFGFLANPNVEIRDIKLDEVSFNITVGSTTTTRYPYDIKSNIDSNLFVLGYFNHLEVFDLSNRTPQLVFAAPDVLTGSPFLRVYLARDDKHLLTSYQGTYLIYDFLAADGGDGLAVSLGDSLNQGQTNSPLALEVSGDKFTIIEYNFQAKEIYVNVKDGAADWTTTTYTAIDFDEIVPVRNSSAYMVGVKDKQVKILQTTDWTVVGEIYPEKPFHTATDVPLNGDWVAQVRTAEIVGTELVVYIGTAVKDAPMSQADGKLTTHLYGALYYTLLSDLDTSAPVQITQVYSVDGDTFGKMPNVVGYQSGENMNLSQRIVIAPNRRNNFYDAYEADTNAHTLVKKSTVSFPDGFNRLTVNKGFVVTTQTEGGYSSVFSVASLLSGTKKSLTARPKTEISAGADRPATVSDLPVAPLYGYQQALPNLNATVMGNISGNKSITNNKFTTLTFDGKNFSWDGTKYVNADGTGDDITDVVLDMAFFMQPKFTYKDVTYHAWKGTVDNWQPGQYEFVTPEAATQLPPFSARTEFRVSDYILTNTLYKGFWIPDENPMIRLAQ